MEMSSVPVVFRARRASCSVRLWASVALWHSRAKQVTALEGTLQKADTDSSRFFRFQLSTMIRVPAATCSSLVKLMLSPDIEPGSATLWKARSRLYQHRILRPNTYFAAFLFYLIFQDPQDLHSFATL